MGLGSLYDLVCAVCVWCVGGGGRGAPGAAVGRRIVAPRALTSQPCACRIGGVSRIGSRHPCLPCAPLCRGKGSSADPGPSDPPACGVPSCGAGAGAGAEAGAGDPSGDILVRSGISDIFPDADIHGWQFEPCGYSCNGMMGSSYFTIHVTPEAESSYVSFGTNIKRAEYGSIIDKVLRIFRPQVRWQGRPRVCVRAPVGVLWRPGARHTAAPEFVCCPCCVCVCVR